MMDNKNFGVFVFCGGQLVIVETHGRASLW